MSDFCSQDYINQELNKYSTNYEKETDIFKNKIENLTLPEFMDIFNSNPNYVELDNDVDPEYEELFNTPEKTNKSTSNSSTPIKSIFNIAKI